MPLTPGTRLGSYEVVAPIGAGGMGEVYRARDTRLDRTVALKVLPAALAADPGLRERFEREARAISSLNHPHICTLYDVGRDGGTDFLVLEHLEGETLAERLAREGTPGLPPDEALRYAIQIAEALHAAHRAGIVHRDLKPANVMLTRPPAGRSGPSQAKLLDFGLAKAAAPVVAVSGLSMLPTTPPSLTAQGTILGTFQYMAPEQIEGLEADARTDIFAFGALLFEMLGGRPPFEGKTRAQLLGAILKDDPAPVSTIQPLAPVPLDRIVRTCLEKDPDDRWQTVRDLLRELRWLTDGSLSSSQQQSSAAANEKATARSQQKLRIAWTTAAVLGAALVASIVSGVTMMKPSPAPAEATQFTISAPDGTSFGGAPGGGTGVATQLAVSPDGRQVVFVTRRNTTTMLWHRPLATAASREIPGTEGAAFPFWSPDNRSVAFFANNKLKRVQIAGGAPVVLCDANGGRGGTWSPNNTIVFGLVNGPLQRVSSGGGSPTIVAALDTEYQENSHRWPHFLPDGKAFLFTAVTGAAGSAPRPSRVKIGSLESAETSTLFDAESSVAYADRHLLFVRDSTLIAQPFDAATRQTRGEPFPVAEQVSSEGSRYAGFSISTTGVLVHARGGNDNFGRLVWFDRSGTRLAELGDPANYVTVSLSPDERTVAASIAVGSPPNVDVWTIDTARGVTSRLTFDPASENNPVWSPDSAFIAFTSLRPKDFGLRRKAATGATSDEPLLKNDRPLTQLVPSDWSADGRFVVYTAPGTTGTTGTDIWALPLTGDRQPFPLVQGPTTESRAVFSPDGRWFAYTSDESSVPQVYVQPFPTTGGRYQVSKSGGVQPLWRRDGKELFFLDQERSLMSVPIDTTRQFEAGTPRALFKTVADMTTRQYAVTNDGQRFLVIVRRSAADASPLPLTVVLDWMAGLQR